MVVLEGETCNIVSYDRKISNKNILGTLWQMTTEDGDTNKVLWASEDKDLLQFVQTIAGPGTVLFIVYSKDYTDYAGFTWLHTIRPGFKSHTGIYIRKKYRGIVSEEACKLCIDFAFKEFDLQYVWGDTIWENSRKLTARLGFEEVAIIPDSILLDGQIYNHYISRIKRG
jgi:RimJ/RimL family protein N-acetyltransferase